MRVRHSIACLLAIAAAGRAAADVDSGEPTPLPKVTVSAEHDSDGYLAERSRTATKTLTPLLDVPQPFRVKTLSLNGMLAQSPNPLALETVMPMELSLDEGEPVLFEGRVAYCTEVDLEEGAVYEIGVEFVAMPEENRGRVETYIQRLKAR